MTVSCPFTARWIDALQHAWKIAHTEHTALLKGRYVKRYDDRGIDVFSEECGRIAELEHHAPELTFAGFDPVLFKRAAREVALADFRDELRAA